MFGVKRDTMSQNPGIVTVLLCLLTSALTDHRGDQSRGHGGHVIICDKSHTLQGLQIGENGTILSPPAKTHRMQPCQVFIKTCPRCKIKLRIINVKLPSCQSSESLPDGGCISQCDHFYLYEPSYREASLRNYFTSNTSATYESLSSNLMLKLCTSAKMDLRAFTLEFVVLEKKQILSGSFHAHDKKGFVLSPNFPHGYAVGSEIYLYIFRNNESLGCIQLLINDWDLAATSKLLFYGDENKTSLVSSHSGSDPRPVILFNGSSLYMLFLPGDGLSYRTDNMGFSAVYKFVQSEHWPEKPWTDCGGYFKYHRGGGISFHGDSHHVGRYYDCIWAVTKSSAYSWVQIRIHRLHLVTDSASERQRNVSLVVRSGLTSLSPVLRDIRIDSVPTRGRGDVLVSSEGFYIRLTGTIAAADIVDIVFTSYTDAVTGGCVRSGDFLCTNSKCIDRHLLCDGVDHCADGSDEGALCHELQVAPTPQYTYSRLCQAHEFACHDGRRCLPQSAVCDNWLDCKDGSDEYFCSTYKSTLGPDTSTPLDCGDRMWKCQSGDECVFEWQRCDDYPNCRDHSDEGNCTPRGNKPVGMTPPWNIIAPVGLSICVALFICVIVFCIRSHYKELHDPHPRHCGVATVSGAVRRRDHRCRSMCSHTNSTSPLTLTPNSDTTFTQILTSPPTYEEALRNSSDTGMFNAGFASSDSDMRPPLLYPPPAYTPSPTDSCPQQLQVFSSETHTETENQQQQRAPQRRRGATSTPPATHTPISHTTPAGYSPLYQQVCSGDVFSSPSHSVASQDEMESLLQRRPNSPNLQDYLRQQDSVPPSPVHSVSSVDETSELLGAAASCHGNRDIPAQCRSQQASVVCDDFRAARPRSRTLPSMLLTDVYDDSVAYMPDAQASSRAAHSSIINIEECLSPENEIPDTTKMRNLQVGLELEKEAFKLPSRTQRGHMKHGNSMPNLSFMCDSSHKNKTSTGKSLFCESTVCDIDIDGNTPSVHCFNAQTKQTKVKLMRAVSMQNMGEQQSVEIRRNADLMSSLTGDNSSSEKSSYSHRRVKSQGYISQGFSLRLDTDKKNSTPANQGDGKDSQQKSAQRKCLSPAASVPNIHLLNGKSSVDQKHKTECNTEQVMKNDFMALKRREKHDSSSRESYELEQCERKARSLTASCVEDDVHFKPLQMESFSQIKLKPQIFAMEASEV